MKTDKEVGEAIRKNMVGAMRIGKPLVIVCGDEFPDLRGKYQLDEKYGITWEEVLQWEPFRAKDQYMKLVKDSENYNTVVQKGKFEM